MKRIVYKRPDGGVSIVTPVIDTTEDEALDREMKRLPAGATEATIVDSIPEDRAFRNAWKVDLTVDMDKAREIHRERLRIIRAPLLAAADIEFQRALESGAPTQDIVKRKQELRDVTADPAIDKAATPEELKAVLPDALKNA